MRELKDGFEIIDDFIQQNMVEEFLCELNHFPLENNRGGVRNIDKKSNFIYEFAMSSFMLGEARRFLGRDAHLVRVIYFNKTRLNNWFVGWHQDKTVAVTTRFDREGWGPWSKKEGVLHVQPPLEVLNQMIAFRLHLDDSNPDNGCLNVIPGSHESGILKQIEIDRIVSTEKPFTCSAHKGSALVMRPHLLHSSSKAIYPRHRRVIHLEYSRFQLPENARWA